MLSFVNNIRITTPDDPEPRPLSRQETETILPLFRRRTKSHFDFEEIAKKLAGKGRYACQGDRSEAPYRFNFARTAPSRDARSQLPSLRCSATTI